MFEVMAPSKAWRPLFAMYTLGVGPVHLDIGGKVWGRPLGRISPDGSPAHSWTEIEELEFCRWCGRRTPCSFGAAVVQYTIAQTSQEKRHASAEDSGPREKKQGRTKRPALFV
jgi:hypothetical protein